MDVVILLLAVIIVMSLLGINTVSLVAAVLLLAYTLRKETFENHPDYYPPQANLGKEIFVPSQHEPTDTVPVSSSPSLPNLSENAKTVEAVMNPKEQSMDDKLFDASIANGYREKKAKEIRSHFNNNNWKKYFVEEFDNHANRDWWGDDEYEIGKKHVLV